MKYLLVTTGFKPAIEYNRPILFAGDWCYYGESDISIIGDSETIKYPVGPNEIDKANSLIWKAYYKLLNQLTVVYNEIFALDETDKYFSYIYGRWLINYLHNIYEKYFILESVSKEFCSILTKSCGKTAAISFDSESYAQRSYACHEFNFRQYSAVAEFFPDITKEMIELSDEKFDHHLQKPTLKRRLGNVINASLSVFCKFVHGDMVLIVSPYYDNNKLLNILRLFVLSKGKVIHHELDCNDLEIPLSMDVPLRKRLRKIPASGCFSKFETIATELLFDFFPLVYVECFNDLREKIIKWKNRQPSVRRIFTSNAIHTNEAFKMLCAETPEAKLLIFQHGGAYGYAKHYSAEKYEIDSSDRYFTWGWGKHTLPHPKLNKPSYKPKNRILLTSPSVTIYSSLLESFYISTNFQNTENNTDLFYETVSEEIRTKIFFRQIYKESVRTYKRKHIQMDQSCSFSESLISSKIHVSNHLSTPFLESMVSNIPTIIFYDPAVHVLRSEAKIFFKALMRVKILFDDPIEAAMHLNSNYACLDDWWLSSEVQEVRIDFCANFAYQDVSWMKSWLKELLYY